MAIKPGTSVKANLKNPEVLQELLEADLEMELIHTKLKFNQVTKIDSTLVGQPGDKINVIAYNYIGQATVVAEGEEITLSKLTGVQTQSPVIRKVAKGCALTDEAAMTAYGNPADEISKQIQLAIRDALDNDIIACLDTAPLTHDDLTNTAGAGATKAPIRYGSVLQAIGKFEDEEIGNYAIFIHPNQRVDLLSDEAFTKVSDATKDTFFFTGAIGKIADADVVLSRRTPVVKVGGAGADKDDIKSYVNYIVKPEAVKLLTKRNVLVEVDRVKSRKQNEVYADAHYVCWLEFGDRVVKLLSPVGYGAKNTIPTHLLGTTDIV